MRFADNTYKQQQQSGSLNWRIRDVDRKRSATVIRRHTSAEFEAVDENPY